MARSPAHKLGQIIGEQLEATIREPLRAIAEEFDLYPDYKHVRRHRLHLLDEERGVLSLLSRVDVLRQEQRHVARLRGGGARCPRHHHDGGSHRRAERPIRSFHVLHSGDRRSSPRRARAFTRASGNLPPAGGGWQLRLPPRHVRCGAFAKHVSRERSCGTASWERGRPARIVFRALRPRAGGTPAFPGRRSRASSSVG